MSNDRATAYKKATSQKTEYEWNNITNRLEPVLVGEAFYGWTDDIVEGEYVESYI